MIAYKYSSISIYSKHTPLIYFLTQNTLTHLCRYVVVGLLQIPCYFFFFLLIKVKKSIYSRWFPEGEQAAS
jgi:hypothetical protein